MHREKCPRTFRGEVSVLFRYCCYNLFWDEYQFCTKTSGELLITNSNTTNILIFCSSPAFLKSVFSRKTTPANPTGDTWFILMNRFIWISSFTWLKQNDSEIDLNFLYRQCLGLTSVFTDFMMWTELSSTTVYRNIEKSSNFLWSKITLSVTVTKDAEDGNIHNNEKSYHSWHSII